MALCYCQNVNNKQLIISDQFLPFIVFV